MYPPYTILKRQLSIKLLHLPLTAQAFFHEDKMLHKNVQYKWQILEPIKLGIFNFFLKDCLGTSRKGKQLLTWDRGSNWKKKSNYYRTLSLHQFDDPQL